MTAVKNGQTQINSQWDILTFKVQNYVPTFNWYFQMSQGANWDTFGPIDASLCSCTNCDSGWVQRIVYDCQLGYPDTSSPRAPSIFNENSIMYSYAIVNNWLQYFYSDEHALSLGVSQVLFPNGTTVSFPIAPSPTSPTCISGSSLQLGSTIVDGSQLSGIDTNGPANKCQLSTFYTCGRPIFPSLFITDITTDNKSRIGDWQQGGQPYTPHKICGTWKSAIKKFNADGTFGITVAGDPTSNQLGNGGAWNLGLNSDPLPVGFIAPGGAPEGYGAEAAWNLDLLNLSPSKSYRFQFMVHDGDQNKAGGDVGQACISATAACPPGFTGPTCTQCDTSPLPKDGSWTWYCALLGTNQYQLLKIPVTRISDPFYAGGFIPGPGVLDPNGYATTCDCKILPKDCPLMCCGNGNCAKQTGVCTCIESPFMQGNCCYVPPPVPQAAPSPFPNPSPNPNPLPNNPPPPPPPPPCYNDGTFCNGNGVCNRTSGQCNCTSPYSGQSCNKTDIPTVITCKTIENKTKNCEECLSISTYLKLNCIWCANSKNISQGHCSDYTDCTKDNPLTLCAPPVDYIPEPCPDNCTGNGNCVNATSNNKDNNKQNNPYNTTTFCLCFKGYSGLNCGQVPNNENIIPIVVGVSAAVIAGIVIAIILGIAFFGGGGAFAYAKLSNSGSSFVVANNPIFKDPSSSGDNPLNKVESF
jgi:hypothetical protein